MNTSDFMEKVHFLGVIMIAFVFMFLLGGIVLPSMGLLGSIVINSIVGLMLLFDQEVLN